MIKTFEQFHENDPYDEEDWGDNNLEKIKAIVEDLGYKTSDIINIHGYRNFMVYVIPGELGVIFVERGDHFVAYGLYTPPSRYLAPMTTEDMRVRCDKEDIIDKIGLIMEWKDELLRH